MPDAEKRLLTVEEAMETYNNGYEPGFGLALTRVCRAQDAKTRRLVLEEVAGVLRRLVEGVRPCVLCGEEGCTVCLEHHAHADDNGQPCEWAEARSLLAETGAEGRA